MYQYNVSIVFFPHKEGLKLILHKEIDLQVFIHACLPMIGLIEKPTWCVGWRSPFPFSFLNSLYRKGALYYTLSWIWDEHERCLTLATFKFYFYLPCMSPYVQKINGLSNPCSSYADSIKEWISPNIIFFFISIILGSCVTEKFIVTMIIFLQFWRILTWTSQHIFLVLGGESF